MNITTSRLLSIGGGALGVFVVLSEIPYWGTDSSLWLVLTALGLAVTALAAANLVVGRE